MVKRGCVICPPGPRHWLGENGKKETPKLVFGVSVICFSKYKVAGKEGREACLVSLVYLINECFQDT